MNATERSRLVAEIQTLCREIRLPSIFRDCEALAEELHQKQGHPLTLLHELLLVEREDRAVRRTARRIKEAGFPQLKTIQGFNFSRNPRISEARIRELLTADFVTDCRPVLLLGGTGTGKTHLASALAYEACAKGHSVRFTTAANLVNELAEAYDERSLGRTVARYARLDLLVLDELGYLPLGPQAAQLLFQVIAERSERKATVITTNLPFGEWTSIFPDQRLCRAFVERVTHRAFILETGSQSFRFEEARRQAEAQKEGVTMT